MLTKLTTRLSTWSNVISKLLIFALMLFGTVMVVLRYFGFPITGAVSISVFLLIVIVYFSLAYAQLRGQHVTVDALVCLMPTRSRVILKLIGSLLSVVACFLLMLSSWEYARRSLIIWERMDGEPSYPLYPIKIVAALGLSALWLQVLADVVRNFREVKATYSEPKVRDMETSGG